MIGKSEGMSCPYPPWGTCVNSHLHYFCTATTARLEDFEKIVLHRVTRFCKTFDARVRGSNVVCSFCQTPVTPRQLSCRVPWRSPI
jgi:hypothetical protein